MKNIEDIEVIQNLRENYTPDQILDAVEKTLKQHDKGEDFWGIVETIAEKDNDLFQQLDTLPQPVRKIVDRYAHLLEMSAYYNLTERFLRHLKPFGYTFDYGLDCVPYNLRKTIK